MSREECVGSSTVMRVIRICLTNNQLGARLVIMMAPYPSANRQRSGGQRKGEARMLIRHASSPRSGAELSRSTDVRTRKLDKGWSYLCR
jgi:hypothetical protein